MDFSTIEIFGYLASALIALSMAVSSIIKFRWINLIGALGLAIYAIIIGAIPVAIVNGLIVALDIYYLFKAYTKNEVFQILELEKGDDYLRQFIHFYKTDIQKFFPNFEHKDEEQAFQFLILRNMNVAGAFIAKKQENSSYYVDLDYVTPEFRDFKSGKYVYSQLKEKLLLKDCTKLLTFSKNKTHQKYLKKLGFKLNVEGKFEINVE